LKSGDYTYIPRGEIGKQIEDALIGLGNQQAKIDELTQTIVGIQGFLKDHEEEGLIEMAYHDDINQIIKDGEYAEKALRGEHE
jgi:hypothetical protein